MLDYADAQTWYANGRSRLFPIDRLLAAISVQFRISDNGEVIDEPMEGVSTFDANGRWTFVGVPSDLAGPTSDAERAAIFSRTIAFSGRSELNGNQLNAKIDVAWNPAFKGFEVTRFIDLEGDRLTIHSA